MADAKKIVILVDITASMGDVCEAVKKSAVELFAVGQMVAGTQEGVSLCVYGDYDCGNEDLNFTRFDPRGVWRMLEGPCRVSGRFCDMGHYYSIDKLLNALSLFTSMFMQAKGGGAGAEAVKSALFYVKRDLDPGLVFIFTDAPPHGFTEQYFGTRLFYNDKQWVHKTRGFDKEDPELTLELFQFLKQGASWEWKDICANYADVRVVTILTTNERNAEALSWIYQQLGDVVHVHETRERVAAITKSTFHVLKRLLHDEQAAERELIHRVTEERVEISEARGALAEEQRLVKEEEAKYVTFLQDRPFKPLDGEWLGRMENCPPETVFAAFELIMSGKCGASVTCLATNPVIGRFWRKICGSYREEHEEACETVKNAMSQRIQELPAEDRGMMKKWLEESRSKKEEIRRLTKLKQTKMVLTLSSQGDELLTTDELCEFECGSVFQPVASALAKVTAVPRRDVLEGQRVLPVDFDHRHIVEEDLGRVQVVFMALSHLFQKNTMFTKRGSFMAAIILMDVAEFKEVAHAYLLANRGRWINWRTGGVGAGLKQEDHLMWAPKFFSLVKRLRRHGDKYLTEEEIDMLAAFTLTSNISANMKTPIKVTTLRANMGNVVVETVGAVCPGCSQERCFTSFLPDGKCNLCADKIACLAAVQKDEHTDSYLTPEKFTTPAANTHMRRCHRCTVHYSVAHVENMRPNIRNKCHMCRFENGVDMRTKWKCDVCQAQFIDELGLMRKVKVCCPLCAQHEGTTDYGGVSCRDVVKENLAPFNAHITQYVQGAQTKLWRKVVAMKEGPVAMDDDLDEPPLAKRWKEEEAKTLHLKGTPITDPDIVAKVTRQLLAEPNNFTCCVCIDQEIPAHEIVASMCGNPKCETPTCISCIHRMYGDDGDVVAHRGLCCFCRQPPKRGSKIFEILKKRLPNFPRVLLELVGGSTIGELRVCVRCKKAFYRERARGGCCGDSEEEVGEAVCDKCENGVEVHFATLTTTDDHERDGRVLEKLGALKNCPNCGVMISRIGGCQHMTCGNCKKEFCWACPFVFEPRHATDFYMAHHAWDCVGRVH